MPQPHNVDRLTLSGGWSLPPARVWSYWSQLASARHQLAGEVQCLIEAGEHGEGVHEGLVRAGLGEALELIGKRVNKYIRFEIDSHGHLQRVGIAADVLSRMARDRPQVVDDLIRQPLEREPADDTRQPDATADNQSDTELAEVMLATLADYASLVAVGFDVAPATFQRTLERLLDPREP